MPKQKEGLEVGQTHPTSTTAVDWHVKVKHTEYDVRLTRYYCITEDAKISSFHKLILTIQQILGSEGQQVGQTLFYWTLPSTAKGPTSTTPVKWHLKVKDTDYDVSLTKN